MQPYRSFAVDYKAPPTELKTHAHLKNPFNQKTIRIEKAIWDTGATSCTIRPDIAKDLELNILSYTTVGTSHGSVCDVPCYVIDLLLPNGLPILGVPVTATELGFNTEMLIGMDIICYGEFFLQQENGNFQFSFCTPPFERSYDILKRTNMQNERLFKKNRKRKP